MIAFDKLKVGMELEAWHPLTESWLPSTLIHLNREDSRCIAVVQPDGRLCQDIQSLCELRPLNAAIAEAEGETE